MNSKVCARLHGSTGWSKLWLVSCAISSHISWAGSFYHYIQMEVAECCVFMPPTLNKVRGHIFHPISVHLSQFFHTSKIFGTLHARVLKFHMLIPRKTFLFSYQSYLPILSCPPLIKIRLETCKQDISNSIQANLVIWYMDLY